MYAFRADAKSAKPTARSVKVRWLSPAHGHGDHPVGQDDIPTCVVADVEAAAHRDRADAHVGGVHADPHRRGHVQQQRAQVGQQRPQRGQRSRGVSGDGEAAGVGFPLPIMTGTPVGRPAGCRTTVPASSLVT